jgi:methionine sulfoxide reductase heme-binding subunit
VRTEQATRPLTEPRTSRGLRRRLRRHHLPLALASAAVLALFLSLPRFDSSKYAQADIFSGTFPRQFAASQTGQHGAGQGGPMQQGGGHQPPQQQGSGHRPPQQQGGGHQPPRQLGEGQSSGVSPSAEQVEERSLRRRLTTGTGYIALVLLALTLLIGPVNLLLRRRNPISSYLRRDVGAWTALFSGFHVLVSLTVHGTGQISHFLDFFVADGSVLRNSFGLGNWTGLAALVIVTGLLALSSDAALRKLKAKNWKRLQHLNYALFALVIAHAFFYGALLRESSPYTILLGLTVIGVIVGQAVGIWLFRRRYARKTVESASAVASGR